KGHPFERVDAVEALPHVGEPQHLDTLGCHCHCAFSWITVSRGCGRRGGGLSARRRGGLPLAGQRSDSSVGMTPLSAAACCTGVSPLDMIAVGGSVLSHCGLLGLPVTEFSKFCCGTSLDEGTFPLVASAMAYRMAYSTIQVCEDTVNSL